MGTLSRDSIVAVDDRKLVKVRVPEWGGDVYVQSLTGAEHDDWEMKWANWRKNRNQSDGDFRYFNAYLATFVVCDESGKLLFTPNDTETLAAKSARALERISRVASRLSGISDRDIEEMAKNFDGAPGASSGTG